MKNETPDRASRGHEEAKQRSLFLNPQTSTTSKEINPDWPQHQPAPSKFWRGFRDPRDMAPAHAKYVHVPISAFDDFTLLNGDGPHPVVHLLRREEIEERTGMALETAKQAGLIERTAEINGECFYRPAPEVRP